MMTILYRPMVKEALVLITSGVVATLICSRVYAAPLGDADLSGQVLTASAPATAQTEQQARQLPPMSQDQARAMLLGGVLGQTPLAAAAPANGR